MIFRFESPWFLALMLFSGLAVAKGGFIELPGDFDGSSNNSSNPWWPLTPAPATSAGMSR